MDITEEIFKNIERTEPHLALFIEFYSTLNLEPAAAVEVTCAQINRSKRSLRIPGETERSIPLHLLNKIPILSKYPNFFHLFTSVEEPDLWELNTRNKLDFFEVLLEEFRPSTGANIRLKSFSHHLLRLSYFRIKQEARSKNEAIEFFGKTVGINDRKELTSFLASKGILEYSE
jgi:hypothetical protein